METLFETHFAYPLYRGKVRDVYRYKDKIALVATDRISAFDVILPRPIPYKGQILNRIAAHFLQHTRDIIPNWWEQMPHPNLSIGKQCQPIPIEFVVRGYLAGHAWRTYQSGQRVLCGIPLPDGLQQNDPLPSPILTPATKADTGHDEDTTAEQILNQGILTPEQWQYLHHVALKLFERGTEMAHQRGLILVDTKYEFGFQGDDILLMDEIHTPDSSRYFYADGFTERQAQGLPQKQLSKEFVREWLMQNGFQGKDGQTIPPMTDLVLSDISSRYQELYSQLIGEPFVPQPVAGLEACLAQAWG